MFRRGVPGVKHPGYPRPPGDAAPAGPPGVGAVCGALGRQLETHCQAGFVPARMTADLFRPVLNEPLAVGVDRSGMLVDIGQSLHMEGTY